MRVGYLCAPPHQLSELIPLTPPWAAGLLAQVAGVRALEDHGYYEEQYRKTHVLREEMREALHGMGIHEVVPGAANFLMFHLDASHPTAARVNERARLSGVFLRDVSKMGSALGERVLRVAVKDSASNQRVLRTLNERLAPVAAYE
jgi:histidinol-phosphate/aromatic aminotransferase/cobyric acid decarboxylase-like protein